MVWYTTPDERKTPDSPRALGMEPDTFDPSQPRVGRRESEPHSTEISYLHDVLATNFPQHRVLWDLHHYFPYENEELDVQFDISFFLDLSIPYTLSSYRAIDHDNRVPRMAINILSKNTWRADLSENLEYARVLKIPVYIVFAPFDVGTRPYQPPFARAYLSRTGGDHVLKEFKRSSTLAGDSIPVSEQIDLEGLVPFNVGLVKLERLHEKFKPLYRLVLVNRDTSQVLLSKDELQARAVEQEKQRAEQEKQRADKYLSILKDHGIDASD
nr:hypothetical protein [Candidatus Sigynarchaeota archaeon]